MDASNSDRLERYTIKRPQEVLLVTLAIKGDLEQVVIFKGFSSSLTRPTSPDPDIPVIPPQATILHIDRLVGPYNPSHPQYLEQGITWAAMQLLLEQVGV